MSAIASMFNQPEIRHAATRIVVSGKTVMGVKDIPPMPAFSDRIALRKRVTTIQNARWRAENSERAKELCRKWTDENRELKQQIDRLRYEKRKNDPEFKRRRKEARDKYKAANPEKVKASQIQWESKNPDYKKQYRERKKHEQANRQGEIGTSNPSTQELGSTAKRGAIPGTRTAAPRLSAIENRDATVPKAGI